jgi:hypothetical protein
VFLRLLVKVTKLTAIVRMRGQLGALGGSDDILIADNQKFN